jgi:hypothetical protein
MFANAGDSAGITLISRDLLDIIAHGLMLVIMNGLAGLTSAACSSPSSAQAPNPGEWAPGLGSAKPIAQRRSQGDLMRRPGAGQWGAEARRLRAVPGLRNVEPP